MNAEPSGFISNIEPARCSVRVTRQIQPITILVANAKGGCGKKIMATNLISYFATQGESTATIDYDPQISGVDWLSIRESHLARLIALLHSKI
jgi:chromosome partitioning protein